MKEIHLFIGVKFFPWIKFKKGWVITYEIMKNMVNVCGM